MRCEEHRADFLAGAPSELSVHHVASCGSCRRALAVLEPARGELDDPSLWEEPSPELEELVVSLIASAKPTTAPARRRRLVGGIAAVAAAVVAFGAWTATRPAGADWELELYGTDRVPEAAATVRGWNTPSGTRVALDIRNLPPAPEGFVYELWFSRDEYYISAGSFSGPSEVELGVGVARRDFPHVWVTLEPLDEDQSPSGQTVLDAEADSPGPAS